MDRTGWIVVALSVVGLVLWEVYSFRQVQPKRITSSLPVTNASPISTQPTPSESLLRARPPTDNLGTLLSLDEKIADDEKRLKEAGLEEEMKKITTYDELETKDGRKYSALSETTLHLLLRAAFDEMAIQIARGDAPITSLSITDADALIKISKRKNPHDIEFPLAVHEVAVANSPAARLESARHLLTAGYSAERNLRYYLDQIFAQQFLSLISTPHSTQLQLLGTDVFLTTALAVSSPERGVDEEEVLKLLHYDAKRLRLIVDCGGALTQDLSERRYRRAALRAHIDSLSPGWPR